MQDDLLEVKVKSGEVAIYKDRCSINNQKGINRIFNILKSKFGVVPKKPKEEAEWFDD